MSQPYYIPGVTAGIACTTTAANNMVTGPRHVLRLVDGGMNGAGVSYLPQPIAPATYGNGFTVGSEEPVYVWGNYNTGPSDPYWASLGANATTPHSAAAIIADAVTLCRPPGRTLTVLLTRHWRPTGTRPIATTGWPSSPARAFRSPSQWGAQDFGTDGGMHNFLRYLEDRCAAAPLSTTPGRMISMYYSQYATGIFKCCNSVYGAPTRTISSTRSS